LEIGSSSLFQAWIQSNPLAAFIILSILIHLIFIGFTRQWNQSSSADGPEMIEFDYREIRGKAAEKKFEIPQLPSPADKADLPEPEYKAEPIIPPAEVLPPVDRGGQEVTLPPGPTSSLEPELTPAQALGKYISYLQDIIDLKLEYPERASREGREGEVTVLFTLNNTGQLLALSIPPEGKAAFHPFNRAALNAVKEAARYFDAFPEVLTEETITFRLPITFTLN